MSTTPPHSFPDCSIQYLGESTSIIITRKHFGNPLHSPSLKPVLVINGFFLFVEFQSKNNFMVIGEDVCPGKEYEKSGLDIISNSLSAKMWIFISSMSQEKLPSL